MNIPDYLLLFCLLFALAPGVLRRLVAIGGSGRRDYGEVTWRYIPKEHER
jgi:hypothetical protein